MKKSTICRLHLSITGIRITDNFRRVYTISEAREILADKSLSIGTSLSIIRLATLNWDMEKLQAYYKEKSYNVKRLYPVQELPIAPR
jgi:hypothetical protein